MTKTERDTDGVVCPESHNARDAEREDIVAINRRYTYHVR